jgi:hypothetical protein
MKLILPRFSHLLGFLSLTATFLLTNVAAGQDANTLLRLQRSKASLNLDTHVLHAQGLYGVTYGKSGDTSSYPNSLACLMVYGDGKYVYEKRDEENVGKPKVKTAEGTLAAGDLQQLKTILDDENLKKIVTPKAPEVPDNATIREIESMDLQIDHAGTLQRLTTIRERLKMGATTTGGFTTGMDTYLDNGAPFRKTLTPLMKWFDGIEKKSRSDLKDSKPQYCAPMNIG